MDGEQNPADLFTKHLESASKLNQLIGLFGCEFRGGRPEAAPQLKRDLTKAKDMPTSARGA